MMEYRDFLIVQVNPLQTLSCRHIREREGQGREMKNEVGGGREARNGFSLRVSQKKCKLQFDFSSSF